MPPPTITRIPEPAHDARRDRLHQQRDARRIADRLRRATRVAVVTHRKADGDALGSTLALVRSLLHLGKDAFAVFPGPWIGIFDPLLRDTPLVHVPEGADPVALLSPHNADAIALVDTGSRQQMGATLPWLDAHADKTLIIDHHASGDADLAAMRWVELGPPPPRWSRASACACRTPQRVRPALDVAEAIYPASRPTRLVPLQQHAQFDDALAADLLDAGVDHNL